MNAFWKDIIRTIQNEKKRLIALAMIAALGVTMMTGLKASCDDLRISADRFFDAQNLHDISIVSTLGLTDDDVIALQKTEGVERVEGSISQTVQIDVSDGIKSSAIIKTFQNNGLDVPYVVKGRLPERKNEIAVSEEYLKDAGKNIGDQLIIDEKQTDAGFSDNDQKVFLDMPFTITGTIIDVTSVINPSGTTAFRSADADSYLCFVTREAVNADYYTVINLTIKGVSELNTYSEEYQKKVEEVQDRIESEIMQQRQKKRYDEVVKESSQKIDDAEKEMENGFAGAKAELSMARQQLDTGWAEWQSGKNTLREQTESAYAQINAARQMISEGRSALIAGLSELESGEALLAESEAKLAQGEVVLAQVNAWITAAEQSGILPKAFWDAMKGIVGIVQEEIDNGNAEIVVGKQLLAEKRLEIEQGTDALIQAENEINAQEKAADQAFYEAEQKLTAALNDLENGEAEYESGRSELLSQENSAHQEIQKAREQLNSIPDCIWYVRSRNALDGYADIKSDADCIESIGTVFPIMFLLVAVLISLTTITRMVEENRGLIGTYSGLGYSGKEILTKYVIYAASAALIGGILGNFLGYVVLPEIIFVIFRTMYLLPTLYLGYNVLYGLGGIALFLVAIVGAALLSCRSTLRMNPAALMRPKPPRSGTRIILERVTFIWTKMSFLNKVTARNLFRYKKRFLMTVFGIAGCSALLLCGFSIKDTVADLMPHQYDEIIRYDVMGVTAGKEDNTKMIDALKTKRKEIAQCLNLQITSAEIDGKDHQMMPVQLYVIPNDADLSDYIELETIEGEKITPTDDGFYVTQNAGSVMNFSVGELITLQDLSLNEVDGKVSALVRYYLGNAVFVTQRFYEQNFGNYEANAVLLNLKSSGDEESFVQFLSKREEVMSVVGKGALKKDFSQSFILMNMVCYVVIVLAGALAFVVLFTLSTTNISERERELATIKMLGFTNREVHRYVNKETIILTGIGILCGLPLGVLLSNFLGVVLKIPAIVYEPSIHACSYGYAALISLLFALIVNTMTNRVLNDINPVTALKSVE